MMKRILLIGAYAGNYTKIGGEIAKVRTLYKYYSMSNKVILIDTYWEKKNIFQYFFERYIKKILTYIRLMLEARKCDVIIVCRADAKYEKIINRKNTLNKTSVFGIGGRVPAVLLGSYNDIDFWNSVNGIFVESEEMVKEFESRGVKTARYVPNFRELPRYECKNYVQDKEILELFYHGKICEEKGLDCLIDAVNKVNKDCIRCKLFLYGEFDNTYNLKNKFSEHVVYSGKLNLMDSMDDYEILRHHDIFVFPTKWKGEGISGSLVDALAIGKPILATRHNVNDKMVTEGYNGYLFDKDDTAGLAELIVRLYNNQKLIYEMGNASLLVAEDFRVENVLEDLEL